MTDVKKLCSESILNVYVCVGGCSRVCVWGGVHVCVCVGDVHVGLVRGTQA